MPIDGRERVLVEIDAESRRSPSATPQTRVSRALQRERAPITSSESPLALRAAGTPHRRWSRRLRGLSNAECRFYRRILARFAAGTPPGRDDLAVSASALGLEVDRTLERLARADLVHHDSTTGGILVAYPFSGRPTAHRVRLDGREVYAMCAIDALGVAPMLGERIEIVSRDPLTGERIRVALEPGGTGSWRPQEAVVVSGATGRGESCECCCPVLNFFASTENAQGWLVSHPNVQGTVISMPEAIVAGRVLFADVLQEG